MRINSTPRFKRAFKKLPKNIQALFIDKMFQFQEHPSFRIKRIQGTDSLWEGSLNMSIRFTFEWITDDNDNDVCLIRNIGDHDHCLRPPY
ncbi:cytotoxin [Desulfosporosinus sp. HMP52]|nr:cytotoxin [Desulfosporosinus sp. HMP52]